MAAPEHRPHPDTGLDIEVRFPALPARMHGTAAAVAAYHEAPGPSSSTTRRSLDRLPFLAGEWPLTWQYCRHRHVNPRPCPSHVRAHGVPGGCNHRQAPWPGYADPTAERTAGVSRGLELQYRRRSAGVPERAAADCALAA